MNIDLQSLGISAEELQERVINRIADRLLERQWFDEDGDETTQASQLQTRLLDLVKKRIDATISRLGEVHVLPRVSDYVENLTLQETNKWGEKTGKQLTFIEYLTARAEDYLNEQVDHNGKSKREESYSWSGKQTRITYLVHQHLQYNIETAMKDALKIANSAIATGIQETVKLKLTEVVNKLKVDVKTA